MLNKENRYEEGKKEGAPPPSRRDEPPMMTKTTVLIVGGLLLGLAVGNSGQAPYGEICLIAGTISIGIYLVWEFLVQRRNFREAILRRRQRLIHERRLDRHVSSYAVEEPMAKKAARGSKGRRRLFRLSDRRRD